jgi:ribosome-associated protein
MKDPGYLDIDDLRLPLSELTFKATRSGGPGGQHVNTSSTQVELWWDVAGSSTPRDDQRELLLKRLETRLDQRGRIRLVSNTYRSQLRNREDVLARFKALVAEALRPATPRKPTKPPRASREARLKDKRHRGERKRQRKDPPEE